MQRITITIDDDLLDALDKMIEARNYPNRSEALRDLARAGLKEETLANSESKSTCFGVLSYVYDHEARNLARRLTTIHHHSHQMTVSSLHVHIDAGRCLEVSILKGQTDQVRSFADEVISQKSVEYGELKIIPTRADAHEGAHQHGPEHAHAHGREPIPNS